MSGSGGSYLAPDTHANSCANLRFDTQLASPKAAVVSSMKVDDILDLALKTINNTQVVIALWTNQIAGSIVHRLLTQLRNCMTEGEQYKARVLQINGGIVRLRVYHV